MNNNKRVLLLTLNKARVIIYSSYEYTLWSVVAIAHKCFIFNNFDFILCTLRQKTNFFNTPSLLTFRALLYNN
jgi:hypothetical protein